MPNRLTALELKEVSAMKPFAVCVTDHVRRVEVIAVNHFDVDEIIIQIDGGVPKRYKICTERTEDERSYFTARSRRYYLDEIVRYNSPWMGGRP